MENMPFHEEYRKKLAKEIMGNPKPLRKLILEEAKKTEDYQRAEAEKWYTKENKRRLEQEELTKPDVELNLDNEDKLQVGLETIATWVYSNCYGYNRPYDPHKGDMQCGEITDKFIDYLREKNVLAERTHRYYKVLDPEGNYNESFGHVFMTLEHGEEHILVDPTYLQWVSEDERATLSPVLQLRYKDRDDLREKLNNTPIAKNDVALPFYLGFKEFKDSKYSKEAGYTVESDDCLRIEAD